MTSSTHRALAYLSRGLVSKAGVDVLGRYEPVWWCVGAFEGWGVSADAQAYFGTRLGLAPGRRHDVVGGSSRWVAAAQSL